MFAHLTPNTRNTAAAGSARFYDILMLITGAYTHKSDLVGPWDLSFCLVDTSLYTGNWSVTWSSVPLINFKNGTSTTGTVHLAKSSVAFPSKTLTFRMELASLGTAINFYNGTFNSDGSSSNVSSALTVTNTIHGSTVHMVGTGASGVTFAKRDVNSVAFAVERTPCPYDQNSNESLLVVGLYTGTTTVAFNNIYNPAAGNYVAFTPNNTLYTPARTAKDENGWTTPALTPMTTEYYENGWLGGDLSKNCGLYSASGARYYNSMDRFVVESTPYRVTNNIAPFVMAEG